jgi:putative phage-type endonuclease
MTADIIQRTPEWYAARCGSLGASRVADALARTKSGWGASRANVMAELIAERLTGEPAERYVSAAMQHGIDTEAEARAAYAFRMDADVVEVGLIRHPSIEWSHASPDGLVGDDGLIEVKCPNTATHLDFLRTNTIPNKYIIQIQWQMACTGRAWCDFTSYDPRLPEPMRLHVRRVQRDDEAIAVLEKDVREFLAEVEAALSDLLRRYPEAA